MKIRSFERVVSAALAVVAASGCQGLIDVERYSFEDADAGRAVAIEPVRPRPMPSIPRPAPVASPVGPVAPSTDEPTGPEDTGQAEEVPDAGVPPEQVPPPQPPAEQPPEQPPLDEPIPVPPPQAPPPWIQRPVLVEPVAELALIGTAGGDERLGVCQNGVITGVREVVNPVVGFGGERLTFVEPICARLDDVQPTSSNVPAQVTVVRDDGRVLWSAPNVNPAGPPDYAAPPAGVTWTPLEPMLCPPNAPVVVGLYGRFFAAAPDQPATSSFPWMAIECAPLTVTADGVDVGAAQPATHAYVVEQTLTFPWDGETEYYGACPSPSVASYLRVFAGFWLDGIVLGCSAIRRADVGGRPCTNPRECQSGVCGGDGLCGF